VAFLNPGSRKEKERVVFLLLHQLRIYEAFGKIQSCRNLGVYDTFSLPTTSSCV
jgi:hypothetical protein